jgi:L-serine deaminase
LDLIWASLVVLAFVSVASAEREQFNRFGIAIAMAAASVKSVLILKDYMAIRRAPTAIRASLGAWVAVCALMILFLH